MSDLQIYPLPEIDKALDEAIRRQVMKLTNGKSMRDIRIAVIGLCVENARLLKEVNEHRTARGFQPLPAFEPR